MLNVPVWMLMLIANVAVLAAIVLGRVAKARGKQLRKLMTGQQGNEDGRAELLQRSLCGEHGRYRTNR